MMKNNIEHSSMHKVIAFLTTYRSDDLMAYSGVNFRLFSALSKLRGYKTAYIHAKPNPVLEFFYRAINFLARHLLGHDFQTGLRERLFKTISRNALRQIHKIKPDAVFTYQLSFSPVFAKFRGIKIFHADCTYNLLVPYLEWKVTQKQFQILDAYQRQIFDHCSLFMAVSSFCISDAVNHYGCNPSKIAAFHFFPSVVGTGISEKNNEKLELLLIGTNYYDKGVPVAVETVRELNNRGVPSHLTIVGVENIENIQDEAVSFLGRINQFKEAQRFRSLYENADLFILPTRHDCAGVVFEEAASFGVPSLSYRTGGVPDYVNDGVSGFLLEPGASGASFAELILKKLRTHEQRSEMAKTARAFFLSTLSEDVFLENAQKNIDSLFGKR